MKNYYKYKKPLIITVILAVLVIISLLVLELTGIINLFGKTEVIKKKIPLSATAKDHYGISYTITFDEKGNKIYSESETGFWEKWEYNENCDQTYFENSLGNWEKNQYDENGNKIYSEDVGEGWSKWEYDENGREIYRYACEAMKSIQQVKEYAKCLKEKGGNTKYRK